MRSIRIYRCDLDRVCIDFICCIILCAFLNSATSLERDIITKSVLRHNNLLKFHAIHWAPAIHTDCTRAFVVWYPTHRVTMSRYHTYEYMHAQANSPELIVNRDQVWLYHVMFALYFISHCISWMFDSSVSSCKLLYHGLVFCSIKSMLCAKNSLLVSENRCFYSISCVQLLY